jgi:hypothetical protein
MKKIALLLITVFAAQAQLLLSSEQNEPYFKHLHQISSKVQQFCRDVEKNKGPVHHIAKCIDLDVQYEALSNLITQINKQEEYLANLKENK